MVEGITFDKKSLKTVCGETADFNELAKDCVAFANAKGGKIYIGIENNMEHPPVNQKIDDNLLQQIPVRISQLTVNTSVIAQKCIDANGAEYIDLTIHQSVATISGTTNGRYFIRIGDQSVPLHPDQLLRLLNDKPSYNWETRATKVHRNNYDIDKFKTFIADIRSSKRVSQFVKEKSEDELLDYYLFTEGDYLTNLGVLWIGKRNDRAKIKYAPAIQFIKYDERGNKVNKIIWDDYELNPKELIEAVWTQVPDWKEGLEISGGLFREFIPNYGERTIRELITNAIVHRPYTTAGDIFINLYPNRLEIHNPGGLPIGVTSQNILHESKRRNEQLCKVAYDLILMEKEGSGYDVIYEELLTNGKPIPVIEERDDRVVVTISKLITKPEIVNLIKSVSANYSLSQKERIAFGLIAQNQSLTTIELNKILDLKGNNPTRLWIDRLIGEKLVLSRGKTRGTEYYINPQIIRDFNFKKQPNLKVIEPHRLKELIYEDLSIYPHSSISQINARIGTEISRYKIREQLKTLISQGRVINEGERAGTRYSCKK
ncbi:MAG: putative DNA binding domain-containing protein [Alistipes sp.]|nr:putative DNA binding domain-containing protein [Alistipes sp.]